MEKKNYLSDNEKLSFISEIKNIVHDWEYRYQKIKAEYRRLKKSGSEINWETLVKTEQPSEIELSEWKRFLALIKPKKTTQKNNSKTKSQELIDAEKKLQQEIKNVGGQEYYDQILFG